MSSLGLTITVYALLVAGVCTVAAVSGRRRPAPVGAALIVLELGALAQAMVDAVTLARGRPCAEVATNLGYLATSLIILPVTAGAVRMDAGRWGSAALAVGCLLLVVVTLRLHATLGTSHG